MVPCVGWSVPKVRFILELSYEPSNLYSCHHQRVRYAYDDALYKFTFHYHHHQHPLPQGTGIVGEARSTSVSFDCSIVLLVGLVDWNDGELSTRLLYREIAGLKFPGYFWLWAV